MLESHPNRDLGPVVVGREREMDEIRTALNDSMSGRGRRITLAGEAGTGRTQFSGGELILPSYPPKPGN